MIKLNVQKKKLDFLKYSKSLDKNDLNKKFKKLNYKIKKKKINI